MAVQSTSILSLFSTLYYVLAGIIGIGFLIGFHELGHFFFAKVFGVSTPSFSLGFGPAIIQKKLGDTMFRISAIPLGGYVEMAGAAEVGQGEQKEAHRQDEGSFAVKPYYQKMLIMFGGILFNLLFAYIAFILLYALGAPKPTTIIETVEENSAAAQAGLHSGDTLVTFDGQNIRNNLGSLLSHIRSSPNKQVTLGIIRDSQQLSLPVHLDSIGQGQEARGKLGISKFKSQDLPRQGIGQALSSGIAETNRLIKATALGFIAIFRQKSTAGMGGPLLIISQITQSAQQGFKAWLFLLILISINLAILNLIPLPILDGGQIVFYTIEALAGRPLPENVRMGIHYVSWIAILLLVAYLSMKDLKHIFGYLAPR